MKYMRIFWLSIVSLLPTYVSDTEDDLILLNLYIYGSEENVVIFVQKHRWFAGIRAIWARLFGHFSEPAGRYSARIAMRHSLCAAVWLSVQKKHFVTGDDNFTTRGFRELYVGGGTVYMCLRFPLITLQLDERAASSSFSSHTLAHYVDFYLIFLFRSFSFS